MGLKRFQIVYDNPYCTYYPGNVVSGKVIFELDDSKKMRAVRIKVKGEAHVKWSETKTRRDSRGKTEHHQVHYVGHETYFESNFDLLRAPSGEMTVDRGIHEYPFAVTLPLVLPSSFEGEWGYIRYTSKGVIDRPWRFDHEVKSAFTVIKPLDLNLNPLLKEPVTQEDDKTFCCFCCASGPFILSTTIPITGFVPGQALICSIQADNTSNVRIDKIVYCLYKKITFRSTSPPSSRKQNIVISELNLQGIGPNSKKTWSESIIIPPLPPSNLEGCGIIDLSYYVKVKAEPSGPHCDMSLNFPITIGSVPLYVSLPPGPQFRPDLPFPTAPPMIQDDQSAAFGWVQPHNSHDPCPPYVPPPSYNESVFGTTNIKDNSDTDYTHGNFDFAPRYPCFDFKSK